MNANLKKPAAEQLTMTYSFGHVANRGLVAVGSVIDQHLEKGYPHNQMLQWKNGSWSNFMIKWPCCGTCIIDENGRKLLTLGLDGRVHVAGAAGFSEEIIDGTREGPEYRGDMRGIRAIGGSVYAVGMARQVYKRVRLNSWERCDMGVVLPVGTKEIAGFNSIDGFSQQEIYAVGFGGEIWRFDQSGWTKINSPTKLALQLVKCAPDGSTYACGQGSILLRGRHDSWSAIPHKQSLGTLRGLEWYNGELYVASDKAIYHLQGDSLIEVNTQVRPTFSSGYLHANDGVLWSFGIKHIAWTEDGIRWNDVTPK